MLIIVTSLCSFSTQIQSTPTSQINEAAFILTTINNAIVTPLALLFAKQETELISRQQTTLTEGVQDWLKARVFCYF